MLTQNTFEEIAEAGQLVATPAARQEIIAESLYDLVPELRSPFEELSNNGDRIDLSTTLQRQAVDTLAQAIAFPSNIDRGTLEILGQEFAIDRQMSGLLAYITQQADAAIARAGGIFAANEELTTIGDRLNENYRDIVEPGLAVLDRHWQGRPDALAAIQDVGQDLAADLEELSRTRAGLEQASEAMLQQPALSPERGIARTTAVVIAGAEASPAFLRAAIEFATLPDSFTHRQQFQERAIEYLAQLDRTVERATDLDRQLQALTAEDTTLAPKTFANTITGLHSGLLQTPERSLQDTITETSQALVGAVHTAPAIDDVDREYATPDPIVEFLQEVHLGRLAQAAVGEFAQEQERQATEISTLNLGEGIRLDRLPEEHFTIAIEAQNGIQTDSQNTVAAFQVTEAGIEFEELPEDLSGTIAALDSAIANRPDLNLQPERFSLSAATLSSVLESPGENGEDIVGAAIGGLTSAAQNQNRDNAGRIARAVRGTLDSNVDNTLVTAAIDRYGASQTPQGVRGNEHLEETLRQAELEEMQQEELELGLELRPNNF